MTAAEPAPPPFAETRAAAESIMEAAWRPAGYTCPNPAVYPWMWLWDSCFHAVVWAALGDPRAATELRSVFRYQTPEGFVPHMGYQVDPDAAVTMWGRRSHSTITQPPMYAHAARAVADAGFELGEDLIERIELGLRFFWDYRLDADGLVRILHPWESGADDSPRWDSFTAAPFTKPAFDVRKGEMVQALDVLDSGASVASGDFAVASAMFNALVAFNAAEFAALTGSELWAARAEELAAKLDRRWRPTTWADGGAHTSAAAPTLDALLPILVLPGRSDGVWSLVEDPAAFAAPFGPRYVDRRHHTYRRSAYWRGPTWPQLNYLLWLAADSEVASRLAGRTVAAAHRSGFAEYWDPETGAGHGAAPQTWTALAVVMHPGATAG